MRLNRESFVYTSADPGLEALYLMYDIVAGPTLPVFHVEFHNSGAQFDVFMSGGTSISVFKDGIPFDPSDPAGGEASIQGAAGFGPSPNAATPHNMFELEVLFDGSDPTLAGHSHGQYSPDPSHWGAGFTDNPRPVPQPETICPPDDTTDPGGDPKGELLVSNACVNVVRGSGGEVQIFLIPLPGEVVGVDIDIKPGSDPNSINCNNQKGTITVAILTSDDFDATTVDHATVSFEGAGETHVDKKSEAPRRHEEDVDGDGDTDLVLHFRLGETGLTCDSEEGTLTGETFDGQPIQGADAVRMVGG